MSGTDLRSWETQQTVRETSVEDTIFPEAWHTPLAAMAPTYLTPTILTLSLPPSTLLGIDTISLTTNSSLYGIKNLPPGPHFLFTGTTASLSIRSGAWFFVPRNPEPAVLVWSWDPESESLVPEKKAEVLMRARANLGSVWEKGLVPYTQSAQRTDDGDWGKLTNCMTEGLLKRILDTDTVSEKGRWTLSSVSSAAQDFEVIPGLSSMESVIEGEKELHFLPIDLKRTWRDGAVGRERTEAAQDRSWALRDLIERFTEGADKRTGAMQVLGELQFTFLMVLTISNYSCLEQWKRLLGLILTCRGALNEVEPLFVKMVSLLKLQLEHCNDVEGGLFEMSEDDGGLLKKLLRSFKKNVDETYGDNKSQLGDELGGLLQYAKEEYGWDMEESILRKGMLELEDGEQVEMDMNGAEEEDETGEYAPVIVDLGKGTSDTNGIPIQ